MVIVLKRKLAIYRDWVLLYKVMLFFFGFLKSTITMQTILGANGAIGIELAQHLKNYTQEIKLVSRNPRKVNEQDILFAADLTARKNVLSAVEGSEVVYVTIGFKYSAKVWRQLWLPFMENVIEACRKHKSKLVFFDNIYAIGGDNVKHITESSPTSPTSKKGEIRAEVDELIMKNVEGGFLDAIIARAPDFFGGVSRENSILINLVYDRMIKGKRAQWLCDADKIHSFGYVPELAKGTAMLGNAETALIRFGICRLIMRNLPESNGWSFLQKK